MNKNTDTATAPARRGRPTTPLCLPEGTRKGDKLTVGDILAANAGKVQCRLTIDKGVNRMVKVGVLARTDEVRKTGTAGRPAVVYRVLTAKLDAVNVTAAKPAPKAKAKAPKLAETAPVELATPAPAPAPAETAPAEPVAA